MSRPDFDVSESYVGTGALSAYTFSFKIEALAQLEIVEYNTLGVQTQRVRGTDAVYLSSVSFDAEAGGGTVNLAANLTTGYTLKLLLANDSPTQTYEFRDKGSFTLKSIENALDKVLGPVQRLRYLMSRTFKIDDITDITTLNMTLPKPAAYESFRWNAAATALEAIKAIFLSGGSGSTDNALVRWDSVTGTLIQNSVAILTDLGVLSGLTQLDVDNIRMDGNTLSSTDANGNIEIEPNGTGLVRSTKRTAFTRAMALGKDTAAITSALLDMVSTTQGFRWPKGTTAERNAIASPVQGLFFYDMTLDAPFWYDGTAWNQVSVGAAGNDAAGSQAIGSGVSSIDVTFATAFPDNNYRVVPVLRNVTDADPQMLSGIITAKAATGFTLKLSATTDSANYVVDYVATRDI